MRGQAVTWTLFRRSKLQELISAYLKKIMLNSNGRSGSNFSPLFGAIVFQWQNGKRVFCSKGRPGSGVDYESLCGAAIFASPKSSDFTASPCDVFLSPYLLPVMTGCGCFAPVVATPIYGYPGQSGQLTRKVYHLFSLLAMCSLTRRGDPVVRALD